MESKNPRALVLMCLLAACTATQAAPFKCKINGKTVYQDVACPDGQVVNVSGAGQANLSSPAAVSAQLEVQAYRRTNQAQAAIEAGKVFVGMRRDEVEKSWGNPARVNKTVVAGAVTEQWVYDRGQAGTQYVYMRNGEVTALQSHE